MRGSGRVVLAGLVFALCAVAGVAFAVEKEPVSGGLLAMPVVEAPVPITNAPQESPAPAPAPKPAPALEPTPIKTVAATSKKEDDTSWGLLVRGGYFGLPNYIAGKLFVQHPKVTGSSYGAEIRYHGAGGGRGIASIGLAVDTATAKADGDWQQSESDSVTTASGNVNMLAFTLTGYWSLFPSWYVHPYFGLGIGVAHAKGSYHDESEGEQGDADYWIPVVHIPIGLAVELGKYLQLAIEGRFIDGIAIGGALQVRF